MVTRAGQVPGHGPGAGAGPPTRGGAGPRPGAGAGVRRGPASKRLSRKLLLALVAAGLAVVAAALVLSTRFGRPPGGELLIVFTPGTTIQQRDAVLAACPGAGKAQAKPVTGAVPAGQTPALRYDVTHAGDLDQAAIVRCVSGRPGVAGIDINRGDAP